MFPEFPAYSSSDVKPEAAVGSPEPWKKREDGPRSNFWCFFQMGGSTANQLVVLFFWISRKLENSPIGARLHIDLWGWTFHFMGHIFQNMGHVGSGYVSGYTFSIYIPWLWKKSCFSKDCVQKTFDFCILHSEVITRKLHLAAPSKSLPQPPVVPRDLLKVADFVLRIRSHGIHHHEKRTSIWENMFFYQTPIPIYAPRIDFFYLYIYHTFRPTVGIPHGASSMYMVVFFWQTGGMKRDFIVWWIVPGRGSEENNCFFVSFFLGGGWYILLMVQQSG